MTALTPKEKAFHSPTISIEETPPAPFATGLMWALAAMLVGAIVWACIGEIEIVATAPGRLIPDGRVKVLQTIEPALVRAIHVREGQRVKEGDLLIELDPTLSQADLSSSHQRLQQNRQQMARLMMEMKGLHLPIPTAVFGETGGGRTASPLTSDQLTVIQAREAAFEAKLAEARASVDEKTKALKAAESTHTKLRLNHGLAMKRYQQSLALVKDGFFSEGERLKQEQEVVGLEHDLAAQSQTLAQLAAGLQEARFRQASVEQERKVQVLAEVEQASREHASLQAEFEKAQQLNGLKTLRAPVSGVVQSIGVSTLGSAVAANQPLLTIVPEDTPLIAEVLLSNNDIGYVRLGQPVEVKLDSFPFTQYGAVAGTVKWISADAEFQNPQALDKQVSTSQSGSSNRNFDGGNSEQRTNGLAYRVQIALTDPGASIRVKGHPQTLQSGMSLQADIQTDRRRLIQLVLNPLEKGWDDGVRVR
ncbi:HlyD family type I secretion periplasmic adaptor subunit [Variovorax sp. 350MFTsu5.1]|uniref:HlyD family type I secretion periplasmic adaptor subunit n=1 Tax=Variovorax sp. 350MFTsu5.1 TaxID=3158365 RepID=UPI003AB04D9D